MLYSAIVRPSRCASRLMGPAVTLCSSRLRYALLGTSSWILEHLEISVYITEISWRFSHDDRK